MRFYGYKHWTLEDRSRCFNIGKGLEGRSRSTNRNHKWHAIVKRFGFRVEVCVGPLTNEEVCAWEIENIALMGTFSTNHSHDDPNDIGCNFTKGGEGTVGRLVSSETREKISAAQRGELSSWYGRKHTDESKRKVSEKKLGVACSTSTKAKIATTLRGQKYSDRGDEWRQKIIASNARRKGIKFYAGTRVRKFNQVTNQTILLCGGPDRCGKSNILTELERITGIPKFKASNEHQNFLSLQGRFILELRYADFRMVDLLYQTGLSILVDRAYMCEWVYSQFFNRETDMMALRKIDNMYAKMDAKIVICTRKSFAGIKDDLDSRLDEIALQKISDLYLDFIKWTKCKTCMLYVDDEDLYREVNEVLQFMGYNKEERRRLLA